MLAAAKPELATATSSTDWNFYELLTGLTRCRHPTSRVLRRRFNAVMLKWKGPLLWAIAAG